MVPIAVLFGVFFYMGVVAMHGLQLVDRVKYLFMHVKHHPDNVGFVTRVRLLNARFIALNAVSFYGVSAPGANLQDAPLHHHPASLPGSTRGHQVHESSAGFPVRAAHAGAVPPLLFAAHFQQ
jgi:hypothetical protein